MEIGGFWRKLWRVWWISVSTLLRSLHEPCYYSVGATTADVSVISPTYQVSWACLHIIREHEAQHAYLHVFTHILFEEESDIVKNLTLAPNITIIQQRWPWNDTFWLYSWFTCPISSFMTSIIAYTINDISKMHSMFIGDDLTVLVLSITRKQ